jgi:hypothetical protein
VTGFPAAPVAWLAAVLLAACGGGNASPDAADADADETADPVDQDGADFPPDVPVENPPDAPPDADAADVPPDEADAPPDLPVDEPPPPPASRFGIGLVGPGDASQWDLAHNLDGDGGWVKLIFPGIDLALSSTPPEWTAAVAGVYARNMIAVIRMGPPWGDRHVRNQSDGDFAAYTQIAAKYRMVAEAVLPGVPAGRPIWFEIHNEPNLCYEWTCRPGEAPPHADTPENWIHFQDVAREYACFLRDTAQALHAIGDERVRVANGGLSPGGAVTCQCDGDGWTGGITALEFIDAMAAGVPGIFGMIDGWATHAYPAGGLGYDFFDSYENSGPGLHFFENELSRAAIDLPVLVTETGWTIDGDGHTWSREQVADFTVQAWNGVWLVHPSIAAVMPFMLQDAGWENFAWVAPDGTPYPVYDAVRALRCSLGFGPPC